MSGAEVAWISVIGTVIVAVGGYFTARLTARVSTTATRTGERAAEVVAIATEKRDAVAGFDALVGRLTDRLGKVEDRLTEVEAELRSTRRTLRTAIAYIERLLDFFADLSPRPPGIPPIPDDLRDQLPSSVVDSWDTAPPT